MYFLEQEQISSFLKRLIFRKTGLLIDYIYCFQLTDELQQSYDRRGNRLGPFKSALEMHREKFALRLERSSEDRTRYTEQAKNQAYLFTVLPATTETGISETLSLGDINRLYVCKCSDFICHLT